MQNFLILKLQGALQAWGTHTYEDYRPSNIFPTRSAVVGLIGACIGIDRDDVKARQSLNSSFSLTVRADVRNGLRQVRITDFHTVLEARKVSGKPRNDAIVSEREYLCDAEFTLALAFYPDAEYSLERVKDALAKPKYTPFLGRRSCPIQRPLLLPEEQSVVVSENPEDALKKIAPFKGTIYSELKLPGSSPMRIRDTPMSTRVRQFATRWVYILGEGGEYVSE